MPDDDMLTDEYVAGLLVEEAKDHSLKYSAMGMEDMRHEKKPANFPRPNTRFLRNIIKGTASHNKALLAKEAAESKARLQSLEQAEEARRLRKNPNARDIRRRQMGDIRAILGGARRYRDGNDDVRESRSRDRGERSHRDDRLSRRDRDSKGGRRDGHRHKHGSAIKRDGSLGREEGRRSRRAASGDLCRDDEDDRRHRGRSRRDRSASPRRRRRSRSPKSDKSKYRRRSRQRHESEETSHRPRQTPEPQHHAKDDDSDSDPLNDLIGPAPPPKHRGRGTIGGAASLDRRFSDTYNPNADIEIMDCDADDWDESVELYRDRHKLRLHQAQRLRAAGFTEDQVRSMEDGVAKTAADRAEKTEKDVVWSKAGERRAWDQGKVLDDDGDGDDDDDGDDDELDRPRTLFSEFG